MIRNVGLTSALNLYRAGIQFGLNIALAHFLNPTDFGQVALVLPITLFVLLIGDFGITGAIVSSSATQREAGAAATICQAFGFAMPLLASVLYATGALGFMPHETAELLLAFSSVALLAMLAVVPRAIMERDLRYGRLTIVETAANTIGFVVAVLGAARGAGVWSFAFYHIAMQAIRSVCFWHTTRERIDRNFDCSLARRMMRFGGWVLAFNLVNYLMRNSDNYIVAGLIGTSELGLYALAYQVMLVPLMVVTWPVSGVLLSTLSRVKDRPDLRRDTFFAVLILTSCVTFPLMTFVAIRAGLVFDTILPKRWADVGPVAGFMAFAGGLQSVTALVGALFMISGRVREQFWYGVGATSSTLATLFLAAYVSRSLPTMAGAYAALTVVLSIGYLALIAHLLEVPVQQVLLRLVPAATLSFTGIVAMVLAERVFTHGLSNVLILTIDALAFGGSVAVALTAWRSKLRRLLSTLQFAGAVASVSANSVQGET